MPNSSSQQPPKTSANWPRSFLHRSKRAKPDKKGARALNPTLLSAPTTRCFSTESAETGHSLQVQNLISTQEEADLKHKTCADAAKVGLESSLPNFYTAATGYYRTLHFKKGNS
jgi:hypothetical protein